MNYESTARARQAESSRPLSQSHRRASRYLLPILLLVVSGCASIEAVRVDKVRDVQSDIKRQIGVYLVQKDLQTAADKDKSFWCGNGDVDFDITSIKITLLTAMDTTGSANVSVPIPPIVTIKSTLSAEKVATSTLVFNEWLEPSGYYAKIYDEPSLKSAEALQNAPIAGALLNLRTALLSAAEKGNGNNIQLPCFSTSERTGAKSDAQNTFTLDIKYVTDGSGGVSVGLGPITAGGNLDLKRTDQNTITVNFAASIPALIKKGIPLPDGATDLSPKEKCFDPNSQQKRVVWCNSKNEALPPDKGGVMFSPVR
jgi:hypothetical protein